MGNYDLDIQKTRKSLENGMKKYCSDVKNEEGFLGKTVSKSISFLQNGYSKFEDSYLEATTMSDRVLVRKYMGTSSFFKRAGYSRALEERGLLVKKADGKLERTQRFKELYK